MRACSNKMLSNFPIAGFIALSIYIQFLEVYISKSCSFSLTL